MKTIVIILSSIAIAAGIVVGWHEHEGSKAASRAEASGAASGAAAPAPGFLAPPAPPPPVERKKKRWKPRESAIVDVVRTDEPVGAASGSAVEARALPSPSAAPPSPGASPRLDAIAASLRKRDFAGAEKATAALLEGDSLSPGERESAERLIAKARALARLSLPAPEGGKSTTLQEVLLANGLRLEATRIEETAESYDIALPSGIRFSAPREDVLQVKPLETRVVVASAADGSAWKELEPKLAKLEHPIDIYVQGVQRLFRMGLDKEGFDLLDRLIERPDSEVIAVLFTSDSGEQSLHDWRRAAGRDTGPPVAAGSPGSGRDAPPAVSADPGALERLRELVDEARSLYQGAAGKEGRGEDLKASREKLDRALDLLESLPLSNEVKLLRTEVAQLISDVSRQLPF